MFLYSNEIVFRGHPDKVCDQISDAILTTILREDPYAHCGIETAGGKGTIFITGEIGTAADMREFDIDKIVKDTLKDIGYSTDYNIINNLGIQSADIARGVDIGGAGDQGMMFGYACQETNHYIPKAMRILQCFAKKYDEVRRTDPENFYPDGKAQITGIYDDNFKLQRIKTFVVSYQNAEKDRATTDNILRTYIETICHEYSIEIDEIIFNPTGRFNIGGFEGDAGLTGRKIVVDNYHSFGQVGGGAFSGKDPTKVDRSAAYKARQLAVRAVRKHNLEWCEVQLSYAIGLDKPMAIYINSDRGIILPSDKVYTECTPNNIIKEFDLRKFDYSKTAQFGHFGMRFPWDDFN